MCVVISFGTIKDVYGNRLYARLNAGRNAVSESRTIMEESQLLGKYVG